MFSLLFIGCTQVSNSKSESAKTPESTNSSVSYSNFVDTSNFTETRNVAFHMIRDYQDTCYYISWALWIDGDIAENGSVNAKTSKDIEVCKSIIRNQENKRIPELLGVFSKN